MYGTIASVRVDPDKAGELQALAKRMETAAGQIGRFVFQADSDPGELWLVGLFESREAYWANAQSPEQHQRYIEMRALLEADPEWHDGEVIDHYLNPSN